MYSDKLQSILKKKKIDVGDEVEIDSSKGKFSGLLMPRTAGAPDILVLKLQNGYNIGIDSKGTEVRLLKKGETKKHPPISHPSRGEIAILGCGGTIASRVEYKTGAVFPAISADELRAAFPELDTVSTIHSRELFELFSDDMTILHWKKLAEAVGAEIKDGAKGVVVMHGTDTLSYTSAALSFMLQHLPVPVVIVGSQRSSDRPSSDNRINLMNAVFAAKQDFAQVGVCMHAGTSDDVCHLHPGTKVRKMHSSRRDAFKSINSKPLAILDYRANRFEQLLEIRKRGDGGSLKLNTKMSDNVAMAYVHPGIRPELISKLDSYDGVVLIATGLGHIPTNPFNDKSAKPILPAVRQLIASGIPIVIAPQTIYGRLDLNVYTNGRLLKEAGAIGDGADWTPECAYVKLCHVLGQTKDMKKVKETMEKNIAGEISERSPLD